MIFFHDFSAKSLIITTKTCTWIHIFKCIYLDGENDSDDAVKTKNAQFFMIFSNISFFIWFKNLSFFKIVIFSTITSFPFKYGFDSGYIVIENLVSVRYPIRFYWSSISFITNWSYGCYSDGTTSFRSILLFGIE